MIQASLAICMILATVALGAQESTKEKVKGGFKEGGRAVGHGARTVGHAFKEGGKAVGHGVKKGAKEVGHALKGHD